MDKIKDAFLSEITKAQADFKGVYRARRAVMDRMYEACNAIDALQTDGRIDWSQIYSADFAIDPTQSFDASITVKVDDLGLKMPGDRGISDALTSADRIQFSQEGESDMLTMVFTFEDLWVRTR